MEVSGGKMGLYTNEIKQLVVLQEVDNEILILEKNLSSVQIGRAHV